MLCFELTNQIERGSQGKFNTISVSSKIENNFIGKINKFQIHLKFHWLWLFLGVTESS